MAARIITAYRLLRPYDYLTYMWDGQLQVPPFGIWRRVDLTGYRNVTEALITSLIGQGLLAAGDWYWVTETPNDTPDRYFRQLLGSGRIWPDDSAPQE